MSCYKILIFFFAITIPNYVLSYDLIDLSNELDYLSTRDMIISKNIANADTPKYKPKDLKKPVEKNDDIELLVTNSGHLHSQKIPDYNTYNSEILEIKPDGNCVTLEHELYKKNENALQFSQASQLYNKTKSMLRMAAGNANK